jgi:hypothetical protein
LQVYDACQDVVDAALDVMDEVSHDTECLDALVASRPALLHLGQRGHDIVMRCVACWAPGRAGLLLAESLWR